MNEVSIVKIAIKHPSTEEDQKINGVIQNFNIGKNRSSKDKKLHILM